MLVTVQMLNAELMQSVQQKNGQTSSKVSVLMPHYYVSPAADGNAVPELIKEKAQPRPVEQPALIAEETPAPEYIEAAPVAEVEVQEPVVEEPAVAEPIKREHTSWIFDPIEAPTLAHQEKVVYELHVPTMGEEPMLNDRLKSDQAEVAHILHEVPIRDLKKAISINDRHRFIEDLFRGDETMYERSIKTINNFNNYAEAEFWMQRELKLKLAWDNSSSQVKLFDQLVRRRFA
jgi:hypothetical protein